MRTSIRKKKGAALGLAAVLGLALVALAVAFFVLSLYFGGSRESRNATDAGALNVGKKSLTVTVTSNGGDESQFDDVVDANNEFGLTNIDRVWGKALFASINAQEIQDAGKENGDTSSHAQAMFNAAQSISDRLADKLNDPNNLYTFFNTVAEANSVRMLGQSAKDKALQGNDWKTSLMERGKESNVVLKSDQLPSGISMGSLGAVTDKGSNQCMPGYSPVSMYGRNFWFVPFRYNERPRLESKDHFTQNQLSSTPLPGWSKPVPNAFSVAGHTIGGTSANQEAMAYVKANPMTTFKMRMPHSYIRLKFPKNTANWYLNGLPTIIPPTSDYGYGPSMETAFREVYVPACGNGQATVSLANEYLGALSPARWLFPIPQPGHIGVRKTLLQRCKEIDPDFTLGELEAILNIPSPTGFEETFYIVPNPAGMLQCVPSSMVTTIAPWISGKQDMSPDSDEEDICTEIFPPFLEPNYVQSWTVECASLTTSAGVGVISTTSGGGTIEWRRGTGYNGFLGEIKVKRYTDIWLLAGCSCVF